MSGVADLTLKQTREKLGVKQDELAKVFAEAKTDDGYDFRNVKCLGADVVGSIAVAEKVKQMNAELDELAKHAETLEGAENAAKAHGEREKARRGFALPGGKSEGGSLIQVKSLGDLVMAEKSYADYVKRGAAGGIDLSFADLSFSDMVAKGAAFATVGAKTLMATSAGYAPESIRLPGYVEMATRPIQLLDIIPVFETSMSSIKYMEETTRTHAAAETAEGGDYAESAFAFTERNQPVVKVTDSLPVTDEQLEDVPMMGGYINSRLTFGVKQRVDGQVIVGSGTGANLRGLKNVAGIQTQATGADPIPDAFYKGMVKVRVTGRAIPTHHVIHPNDWQSVRLMRTADGVYIYGPPSDASPDRLWGLPVVQQDADAAGTGYVGSFQPAWVSMFERKGVDIAIGYVGSQFTQGKRTVRADTSLALVWNRPAAFCQVTGIPQ